MLSWLSPYSGEVIVPRGIAPLWQVQTEPQLECPRNSHRTKIMTVTSISGFALRAKAIAVNKVPFYTVGTPGTAILQIARYAAREARRDVLEAAHILPQSGDSVKRRYL